MSKKNYSTDQRCLKCKAYTENGNTFHHIKTRGSGGSDEIFNLMPLCFFCHELIHKIGTRLFAQRNIFTVTPWLENHGWILLNKQWWHPTEGEENV